MAQILLFKIINTLMKTRIQLIENSPLHKVPTILISIYKTQFIFNVIPTLLRHRKAHKLNLFNSSYIFFTKNSIEALGGLPNYLLFRSGVQNSNSVLANRINIYGDNQIFEYLQKLRFKLGYKILRFSYCSWETFRNRLGISKISLLNQLKLSPQFPKIFVKIDDFIKSRYKKEIDYYQSNDFIQSNASPFITIDCKHFHHDLMDIYPLLIKDQTVAHSGFICIPSLRKKGEINIEEFVNKTSIRKQALIKEFVSQGFINKDGRIFRKDQFVFKSDYKPKNILIFHYISIASISQLAKHPILNNYLSNNNETGVIIHIVQDILLLQTPQFKLFMSKFKENVNHQWFNKDLHSQNYWESDNLNYQELKLWSLTFPNVFHNVCLYQNIYTSNWNNKLLVSTIFPLLNHLLYRKLYNLIINDYVGDAYQKRQQTNPTLSKIDILKALLLSQSKLLKQLQAKCNHTLDNDKFHPRVSFLGTASSMPTPSKNTLGILVSLNKQINIVLDCGQGTFQQLTNHLNPQHIEVQVLKVRIIFITHIHSDHNLGILNFISERNKMLKRHKRQDKLFLIIPFNVYNWYEQYNRTIQDLAVGCEVLFTQIVQSQNIQAIKKEIQTVMNKTTSKVSFFHKKKSINQNDSKYCKNQINILSQLETSARTKELVLKELPTQIKVLKNFQQCLKKYGFKYFKPIKVVHCPQSYGVVVQNHQFKVGYSGDTRPSKQFEQAAKNCNLMIHEATFNDKDKQKASEYLHSTVFEAIQVGKKANALKLALTHYNQDFQYPQQVQYVTQYKEYFKKNTIFSLDHLNLYLDSTMEQLPSITQFIMKADIEATDKVKEIKDISKYDS